MNSRFTYIKEHKILAISLNGQITTLEFMHTMNSALNLAKKENVVSFLINISNADWKLTDSEIQILPRLLGDIGLRKNHVQALILNNYSNISKNYRKQFLKKGYSVDVFFENKSAIEWLKEKNEDRHLII